MRHFLAAMAVSAAFAGAANAAVLFSDGFAADSAGFNRLNYTGFSNWTVTGAVDLVNEVNPFGIVCGGACVDLAGTPGLGTLTSIPIALEADKEVVVTFTLSGNQRTLSSNGFLAGLNFLPANPSTSAPISGPVAFTTGLGYLDMLNGTPYAETVAGDRGFVTYSYKFRPSVAGTFTMSYGATSATNDRIGPVLGSVLVSTSVVPEPAAWAMMIGGFGMAGVTLRHRRALVSSRKA